MRRRLGTVLVGRVLTVLLGGASMASASTAHQPPIPRGFAYAAQVRIAVTYDASFEQSNSREQVCTDPMSGEQTTTYLSGSESRQAKITAVYGPITVPVTTLSRLGSAAGSAPLTLTRTAEVSGLGAVTGATDTYRFTGQGLEYPSCTTVPWNCAGAFATAAGYQPVVALRTGAYGYDPIALTFALEGSTSANPAVCTGGDQAIDVASTLDQALAAAHTGVQQPWGAAELDSGLTRALDKLATSRSVTITAPARCSYISECYGAISTSARVVITRLALMRTARSYPGRS